MKTPTDAAQTAPQDQGEPSNVLVETTRKQVRIRKAIVSGRPNFGITMTEAKALQEAGLATIVGTI